MDKALFRAYVRELVKEMVAEEVKKVLPDILAEAVQQVQQIQETAVTPKPKLDRSKLAAMLGIERHGDTFTASTSRASMIMPPPPGLSEDNPAVQAVNKDYSQMMKKMGLSK